ncbi:MAG TPA: hypothetical protein VIL65_08360 [Beijerinckiaceae bacterium]|jgi:hypothetical protein
MRFIAQAALVAGLVTAGAALAQTNATGSSSGGMSGTQPGTTQGRTDTTTGSSNNAVNPANRTGPDAARTGSTTSPRLEAGSNSFTEAQARGRIEAAGFQDVKELKKDDQGIWRGQAMQSGRSVSVGVDYKGNVATQ